MSTRPASRSGASAVRRSARRRRSFQDAKSSVGQVRELQRRHHPAPVAGAVDPAVVHADEHAVAGQPDVALEGVGAVVERRLEGLQGVLRVRPGRAAVGDHLHRAGHGSIVPHDRRPAAWTG